MKEKNVRYLVLALVIVLLGGILVFVNLNSNAKKIGKKIRMRA